jgi:hypothetical protein
LDEIAAREVLLIRAIELGDPDGAALPLPERARAGREAAAVPPVAGPEHAGGSLSAEQEAYLVRRARLAREWLEPRYPALAGLSRASGTRTWVFALLPAAVLVLGAAGSGMGAGRAINILAFPLLGMLAWNLAVYALLALRAARPPAAAAAHAHPLRRFAAWLLQPSAGGGRRPAGADAALSRGLALFARDWAAFSAPLAAVQAARLLHLCAATLAVGAVSGMYLRGLAFAYLAGWESTFLDAHAVESLLGVVLGPASLLTGIPLPDADRLEQIRWAADRAGENAAPWIHLYAATTLLFIVLPRLALALAAERRARRLRRHFPMPDRSDPYLSRLLKGAQGRGETVRVLAYSYRPADPARAALEDRLRQASGGSAAIEPPEFLAYGGEDEYLERAASAAPADRLVLLFNLAATPEEENHGVLARGLLRLAAEGKAARRVDVLVDESAYRERLAGESGAAGRLAQRRAAWGEILRGLDWEPVDLAGEARP